MDTAYLCIHGFNGGLEEIDYLARYLKDRNLDVCPVALAGHGEGKKRLKESSPADWFESAEREADKLIKEYKHIVFIGF